MLMRLKAFMIDEEAAAATEYAIMLSLLLLVIVGAVATLGAKTKSTFNNTASVL